MCDKDVDEIFILVKCKIFQGILYLKLCERHQSDIHLDQNRGTFPGRRIYIDTSLQEIYTVADIVPANTFGSA